MKSIATDHFKLDSLRKEADFFPSQVAGSKITTRFRRIILSSGAGVSGNCQNGSVIAMGNSGSRTNLDDVALLFFLTPNVTNLELTIADKQESVQLALHATIDLSNSRSPHFDYLQHLRVTGNFEDEWLLALSFIMRLPVLRTLDLHCCSFMQKGMVWDFPLNNSTAKELNLFYCSYQPRVHKSLIDSCKALVEFFFTPRPYGTDSTPLDLDPLYQSVHGHKDSLTNIKIDIRGYHHPRMREPKYASFEDFRKFVNLEIPLYDPYSEPVYEPWLPQDVWHLHESEVVLRMKTEIVKAIDLLPLSVERFIPILSLYLRRFLQWELHGLDEFMGSQAKRTIPSIKAAYLGFDSHAFAERDTLRYLDMPDLSGGGSSNLKKSDDFEIVDSFDVADNFDKLAGYQVQDDYEAPDHFEEPDEFEEREDPKEPEGPEERERTA